MSERYREMVRNMIQTLIDEGTILSFDSAHKLSNRITQALRTVAEEARAEEREKICKEIDDYIDANFLDTELMAGIEILKAIRAKDE